MAAFVRLRVKYIDPDEHVWKYVIEIRKVRHTILARDICFHIRHQLFQRACLKRSSEWRT